MTFVVDWALNNIYLSITWEGARQMPIIIIRPRDPVATSPCWYCAVCVIHPLNKKYVCERLHGCIGLCASRHTKKPTRRPSAPKAMPLVRPPALCRHRITTSSIIRLVVREALGCIQLFITYIFLRDCRKFVSFIRRYSQSFSQRSWAIGPRDHGDNTFIW